MRSNRTSGIVLAAIALVAVLAMGTMSVNAGLAGNLDAGLPFFAQNGNGQGKGNSDNSPPTSPGTGNNGQGQGQENGSPPEDPGVGNNSQGEGNGNVPVGAGDEAEEVTTEVQAEAQAPEKVNICHVTDEESGDTVMITVSERAVPAHEGHGDTLIGVESEAECPEAEVPEDGEGDDDGVDAATPVATPDVG